MSSTSHFPQEADSKQPTEQAYTQYTPSKVNSARETWLAGAPGKVEGVKGVKRDVSKEMGSSDDCRHCHVFSDTGLRDIGRVEDSSFLDTDQQDIIYITKFIKFKNTPQEKKHINPGSRFFSSKQQPFSRFLILSPGLLRAPGRRLCFWKHPIPAETGCDVVVFFIRRGQVDLASRSETRMVKCRYCGY